MKPSSRRPVHKGRSARSFKRQVGRTHPKNMKPVPMRGGIRL